MNSETSIIYLESSHSRESPKKSDRLSFSAIIESIISSSDRLSSFSIALSHDLIEQTTREDNREAAAIIHLSHIITITSSFLEQSQIQERLISNEEWKITRIVDKKLRKTSFEYKMCWKKTWLSECELEKAQKLLQKFEFKYQTQRERKWERKARADNNWWSLTILFVRRRVQYSWIKFEILKIYTSLC